MGKSRIISWNINGLRACVRKGFMDWLEQKPAEIICLQEVRAREDQLEGPVKRPKRWKTHFVAAERPGYSGVGVVQPQKMGRPRNGHRKKRIGR